MGAAARARKTAAEPDADSRGLHGKLWPCKPGVTNESKRRSCFTSSVAVLLELFEPMKNSSASMACCRAARNWTSSCIARRSAAAAPLLRGQTMMEPSEATAAAHDELPTRQEQVAFDVRVVVPAALGNLVCALGVKRRGSLPCRTTIHAHAHSPHCPFKGSM